MPKLQGKAYADFKLSPAEWKVIELAHRVLKEPAMAQQSLLAEKYATVSFALPILECLQSQWEALLDDAEFAPVHEGLRSGLKNLAKWYRKTDDTLIYFATLRLWLFFSEILIECSCKL